jgi:hypothetical protein
MIGSYKMTTSINITIAVSINANCISGVMVSVLTSSAVDRGFESWLGQTKDYIIINIVYGSQRDVLRKKFFLEICQWFIQNINRLKVIMVELVHLMYIINYEH